MSNKDKVLEKIKEVWELNPEMSLCELLSSFIPTEYFPMIDDEILMKILDECSISTDAYA